MPTQTDEPDPSLAQIILDHVATAGHVLILDEALSTNKLPINMVVNQKIMNGAKLVVVVDRKTNKGRIVKCRTGDYLPGDTVLVDV